MPVRRTPGFGPWLIAAAVLVSVATLARIGDPDYFWHLAMGRAMFSEGRILHEDVFSFTLPGAPFHNHEWLAQLAMYGAYAGAGHGGAQWLAAACAGIAFIFLVMTARAAGADRHQALLIALCASALALPRWVPRPEMFSLVLTAAYLYLMTAARRQGKVRRLWWLPLLQLCWDHLHGPIYGTLLLSAGGAGCLLSARSERADAKQTWRELAPLCAALLCVAIDPGGARQMVGFLGLLADDSGIGATLSELLPPLALIYWPAWVAGAGVLALSAIAGRRLDYFTLLIALPFVVLAIRYNRAIAFAAFALVPWVSSLLTGLQIRGQRAAGLFLAMLTLGAVGQHRLGADKHFAIGIDQALLPTHTVDLMRRLGIDGPGYHWNGWGGLVAWSYWPERAMFIYNHHVAFRGMPQLINSGEFVGRWPLQWALVGQAAELRHFPFPQWVALYWDENGALLVPNSPRYQPLIARYGLRWFQPLANERQLEALANARPDAVPQLLQEIDRLQAIRPSPRWRIFADRLRQSAGPTRPSGQ